MISTAHNFIIGALAIISWPNVSIITKGARGVCISPIIGDYYRAFSDIAAPGYTSIGPFGVMITIFVMSHISTTFHGFIICRDTLNC